MDQYHAKLNKHQKEEREREAFEYGYDAHRFGFRVESAGIRHHRLKEIATQGRKAARDQCVSQKLGDIFERKWMSIRGRSLGRRGCSISPYDISVALKEAGGYCPVTQAQLERGTLSKNDWSVDRIDNSRGYHPDNILILSATANSAKSDMNLNGIIEVATLSNGLVTQEPYNALSVQEWHSMARLFYHKLKLKEQVDFCDLVHRSNQHLSVTNFCIMSSFDTPECKSLMKELESDLGTLETRGMVKAVHQRFKRVVGKTARNESIAGRAVMGSDKTLFLVMEAFMVMRERSEDYNPLLMDAFYSQNNPTPVTEDTFFTLKARDNLMPFKSRTLDGKNSATQEIEPPPERIVPGMRF